MNEKNNSHSPSPNKVSLFSWVAPLVNNKVFQYFIFGLILINAAIVGLETYPQLRHTYELWFYYADVAIIWIFTIEIALRLIASRPTLDFFKDGWNVFDFFIVAASLIFAGAYFVTVLRILRVLRLLRTISIIPSLKRLVNALMLTLPSLGNIVLLLSLIFYIFGVIGTMLFSSIAPEYFGTLQASLITLFQVVTLESWASAVMRPILEQIAWAWIYFVAFILMGTFVIFNLFVGVIVSNVEKEDRREADELSMAGTQQTNQELAQLKNEIAELKTLIVNQHKEK